MQNFKLTCKRLIYLAISTTTIVFNLGLSARPAQAITAPTEPIPAAPLFCASINVFGNQIESNAQAAASKPINLGFSMRTVENNLDTVLQQKRSSWDSERNKQYEAMLAKATNDSQKQAIENFKTTIEGATKIRRSAIDNAIKVYFNDSDAQMRSQSILLNSQRLSFASSVSFAVKSAKQSCSLNENSITIRQSFQTNLEQANLQLENSRQSLEDFDGNISKIRKTEAQAINDAVNVFRQTLKSTRQTLSDQLKNSGADADQFGI